MRVFVGAILTARFCLWTEIRHIWHLSLVTLCHFIRWDRRTNCCLAVLTRPWSWRTRHFLLVRQRSRMTCLLTVVRQLLSIVLNAILNATILHRVRWSLPVTVASRASDSVFLLGLIGALQIGFDWLIDWLGRVNFGGVHAIVKYRDTLRSSVQKQLNRSRCCLGGLWARRCV